MTNNNYCDMWCPSPFPIHNSNEPLMALTIDRYIGDIQKGPHDQNMNVTKGSVTKSKGDMVRFKFH